MTDRADTGKGGGPTPFVNAFDHPQLGSLRYNTSQAGSPIALCYGTHRVSVNVVELWGFAAAGGKKGANQNYAINAAFALCQGPVSFTGSTFGGAAGNRIWANDGVATGLASVG